MDENIRFVKGIGEARAASFEKLNIRTVSDLVYFFPRGYEDRSECRSVVDCVDGETVCISAVVSTPVREAQTQKKISLYFITVHDDTGSIKIVWYNNKFVRGVFKPGDKYIFFGRVSKNRNAMQLENPIYEKPGAGKYTGRIIPLYPLTAGLAQKCVQTVMSKALERVLPITEYIPESVRSKYKLAEINYSMKNIHFPDSFDSYSKARERLVFEELLILQLSLLLRKGEKEQAEGRIFKDLKSIKAFTDNFGFELTGAQKRTINEICMDFKSGVQMNRLIQGDVGSGKTAVAAAAIYIAVKNGSQAVMMAPTEILASQHYDTFCRLFEGTGINVVKLTSGIKDKGFIYDLIENGLADVIIGTHAVIEKRAVYKNVGLVVADEQHRFGVEQRARLLAKGENPHMIIMSATPIPRTLALILYGDLKISVIDELPPGRKPVKTYSVDESMRRRIYAFLEKNINEGNQAYIVCPLIEETQNEDLKNASDIANRMSELFPRFKIGLIHGRMKSKEKDLVMSEFAEGKIKILVSTTVIEVGVNVPKANMMIIENAERFGLSQLHQLRGRVGRGSDQAFCIMFSHGKNDVLEKRMKIMCESNDGFYISEQDLKLRGPGDFFGTRQHGLPEMKIANLFEDREILAKAQKCAAEMITADPGLENEENIGIKEKVQKLIEASVVMN